MLFNENQQPMAANEISAEQKQHSAKYLGSRTLQRGMTMYQMEVANGEIKEVQYEYEELNAATGTKRKKMKIREGYMYCSALNIKNAERKFKKSLNA